MDGPCNDKGPGCKLLDGLLILCTTGGQSNTLMICRLATAMQANAQLYFMIALASRNTDIEFALSTKSELEPDV